MTARQKHNSRKGRSASWIRREKRIAIYLRDGMACAYCGTDLRNAKPTDMGLDHLEPQVDCDARGGCTRAGLSMHHESNLVTACRKCNSSRQDRPWRQFATAGAVARIVKLRRRVLNMAMARAFLAGEQVWGDA
jgi:5-methylcytosine-specific restriction endonuclease McrA